MSSKPALILVPGSFCPHDRYDDFLAKVHAKGVDVKAIPLQTVGKRPGPLPTVSDDAASIAAEVEKVADEGKDIVLIGHSYGGIPVSESVKGLSKKERESKGKKGGIVRVAYLTAVVPPVGESCGSFMAAGGAPAGYVAPDEDGWLYHPDPVVSAKAIISLPPEEGAEWVKRTLTEHSSVSFGNELTYPGYADVPASYLYCTEDLCVTPTIQQAGIDTIEKASGRKVDVYKIKADHIPNDTAPEDTVAWFVHLSELGAKENA